MRELVHTLAAWSGKFMDLSAIGSGLSIRRPTIESYINALETLYLVERVYPWTKTDYARVGKQSRLFMVDKGFQPYAMVPEESDKKPDIYRHYSLYGGISRLFR
jgi:predicted AAA+ superfamily ATPase